MSVFKKVAHRFRFKAFGAYLFSIFGQKFSALGAVEWYPCGEPFFFKKIIPIFRQTRWAFREALPGFWINAQRFFTKSFTTACALKKRFRSHYFSLLFSKSSIPLAKPFSSCCPGWSYGRPSAINVCCAAKQSP